MFGQFKTRVADEITAAQAKKLSVYFGLPPAKHGEIEQAKNPGITLLTLLENDEVIGEDVGIDELCEAFKFCSLNRLARIANDAFQDLKKTDLDTPDTAPVYTKNNSEQLKKTLRDQLTQQQCEEIAMFLGLKSYFIGSIQSSRNPAEELVQILQDQEIIKDSNISLLIVALKSRGLQRVASLVIKDSLLEPPAYSREAQPVEYGKTDKTPTVDSIHSTSDLASIESENTKCFCQSDDFEELKSLTDELLSIQCKQCKSEWITKSSSSVDSISLQWNTMKFFYETPIKIQESEMQHEIIDKLDHLIPGDHIVMRRLAGFYDHHAIFLHQIDNKMKMINWAPNITFTSIAAIKCEVKPFPKEVRRVVYPQEDPAHIVMARAYKLYKAQNQGYSITGNNCESLATYCKIGKGFTMQGRIVNDVLPPVMSLIKSLNPFSKK